MYMRECGCIYSGLNALRVCADLAFVDRADIKQFIGLPSVNARYEILRSCIQELILRGVVVPDAKVLISEAASAAALRDRVCANSDVLFAGCHHRGAISRRKRRREIR